MQTVREFKLELIGKLEQLVKKANELNLLPINLEEINRNFEMINSGNEIVFINEADVTYSNQRDMEDFETEFEFLSVEDIEELIDIVTDVIEEEETDQEKTEKRISN